MASLKIRYLEKRKLKDGTVGYCWNCRHAKKWGMDGHEWLGPDVAQALARATMLNEMLDAIRRSAKSPTEGPAPGTTAWMIDQVLKSDDHKGRPAKGAREVEAAFEVIRKSPLGKSSMEKISEEDIKIFARRLTEAKSLDYSARVCKWLRYLLNRAVGAKKLSSNPMTGMRIKKPQARQVYWEEAEVTLAIKTAKEMGRHSIAIAIRLAFDLGQREGDVLVMTWSRYQNGDMTIPQSKTDAVVRIPALPELREALGSHKVESPIIVISETTGKPYTEYNFQHRVRDVLIKAGIDKRFSDLRRSAVVRLAQAGCTIPEIAAVTGHSYARCEAILEVYLPRTTPMARAAIQKLLDAR